MGSDVRIDLRLPGLEELQAQVVAKSEAEKGRNTCCDEEEHQQAFDLHVPTITFLYQGTGGWACLLPDRAIVPDRFAGESSVPGASY
jgi:hypothetical protein